MTRVILDTGPLVAFLDRRGRHHEWASAQWGLIRPPFLTCESVLAEACFLMAGKPGGLSLLFELLCRGVISLPFRLEDHAEARSQANREILQHPNVIGGRLPGANE